MSPRPLPDRRRWLLIAGTSCVAAFSGCASVAPSPGDAVYPALGRRLQATFPGFRAELHFHSASSMSFVLLSAGAASGRSETVKPTIRPVTAQVFLVAWQEANKTTVVQVHDFSRNTILTNITRPDGSFFQAAGSFVVAD